MKLQTIKKLALVVLCLVWVGTSEKTQTDESSDLSTQSSKYLLLIKQLGSNDWQTREKTQEELIQLDEELFD